jgi:hypothetical protein
MTSQTSNIYDEGASILAAWFSSGKAPKLPVLALSFPPKKFNLQDEHKRLMSEIPPRVLQGGKVLYPQDFRFLDNKKVSATRYPALSDTLGRRVMSLANLYFNNVVPEEREDELFDYCGGIPGIDIIDRTVAGDNAKTCDWFVFRDDPWFAKADRAELFGKEAVKYLTTKGYQQSDKPVVGGIIIYCYSKDAFASNAYKAGHYGKIVAIDTDGEPVIESKFCHSFVYRHQKELVLSYFGNEYVYMKRCDATSSSSKPCPSDQKKQKGTS